MKILITGANGMLAKSVKARLKKENELICTDVSDLDITNAEAVMNFVKENKPEYIINCAAFTAVDKAEEVYDLAEKINADGPGNLAKAAKEVDATLIHISTDYVFNGDLDVSKSYVETDEVGPVTVYGKTKLHGEEQVKSNTDQYYIFRTAWLYGDGNNFVRTMLKLGTEKDEISVVADQHGSPTYAEDLANIIAQAIEKKIPYGLYHSTNQGFTTWYEFTKKIFELADIKCNVKPVTSEEFIRPAKRPKNSQLNKQKLLDQEVIIPNWEDGLKRYLEVELH
ncbi:MAG: dTDP-4-dehydrorhamnose reductase [Clostridium sp. 27_14]|nr:MAG: dTDP-4-dehydrorhamnose reductase [Clostridium sp. 27_14]